MTLFGRSASEPKRRRWCWHSDVFQHRPYRTIRGMLAHRLDRDVDRHPHSSQEDIAMTSVVLVLALGLSGQSPQGPGKVLPNRPRQGYASAVRCCRRPRRPSRLRRRPRLRPRSCRLLRLRPRSLRLLKLRPRSCRLLRLRPRSCRLLRLRARSCRLLRLRARLLRLPMLEQSCRRPEQGLPGSLPGSEPRSCRHPGSGQGPSKRFQLPAGVLGLAPQAAGQTSLRPQLGQPVRGGILDSWAICDAIKTR